MAVVSSSSSTAAAAALRERRTLPSALFFSRSATISFPSRVSLRSGDKTRQLQLPKRSPVVKAQSSAVEMVDPTLSPRVNSVKPSKDITSPVLPSTYAFAAKEQAPDGRRVSDHVDDIPVIDVSLLLSNDPEEIHKLGRACEEWGFFLAINHGVSDGLMKRIQEACGDFFNMAENEKRVYLGKDLSDPVFYGTSSNHSHQKILYWREFLKIKVHPKFHSPEQPEGFRVVLEEYCEKARELAGQLLRGISKSLGYEKTYIGEAMDMDQGLQIFSANFYPPCPDPENVIELPAHTDHGLLTLLMQNGIHGLQILNNGKWIQVEGMPGSLFVNTCDQIQIFTNGKYKSVVHKVVVNRSIMRKSVVVSFGPSLDTIVGPSERLLERENSAAAYNVMKYREYYDLVYKGSRPDGKSTLEALKIMP